MAVDERRPEGSGPERQLEVDERERSRPARPRRPAIEPRPPEDARLDRQHVQADRGGQEQRQRVVADRRARRRRAAATSQRSARGSVADHDRRRRGRGRPSRRAAGAGSRRAPGGGVRVGVRADRPGDAASGRAPRPAATPMASRAGQRPDQVDRDGGGDRRGRAPRAGSSGTPASPNGWSRTDASQPSRTYVGKPVGWAVPRTGPTVWNSAGVPERDPGQQRQAREGERHDADREGRRQVRGARTATLCYAQIHLPRSCRSRSR